MTKLFGISPEKLLLERSRIEINGTNSAMSSGRGRVSSLEEKSNPVKLEQFLMAPEETGRLAPCFWVGYLRPHSHQGASKQLLHTFCIIAEVPWIFKVPVRVFSEFLIDFKQSILLCEPLLISRIISRNKLANIY